MGGRLIWTFNLWTRCAIDVALRQRVVRERGYHVHEDASQRENSICADPFTVATAFRSKWERY